MRSPRIRLLALAAAVVACTALLAGCSSPATPAPTAPPTPATSVAGLPTGVQQATNVPTAVPNTPGLRKNVSVSTCEKADGGWQAEGTAANPGSDPVDYTISVFFTTDKGTVIGTGDTKVTVDPGKTGNWRVKADLTPAPKTICVLRGVGAAGWRRHAPDDELDLAPMADGGPGFVDVLHAALGGELSAVTVSGPHGAPVPAVVLRVGETAYVESAQAAGLHLVTGPPETATSRGVGELVLAAASGGARTVVVGLGGSGTNDGGAGVLAALGATSDGVLDGGAAPLGSVTTVDLSAARSRLAGVTLVAASDVDNPLTGLFGATKTFGPQKGIGEDRIAEVDGWLEAFAAATDRRTSLEKGAGAAGGIGYALLALGATREPGIELVTSAVSLASRARACDLVVTGEGAFDFSSRAGKVPYGVAGVAAEALRPCIALAGQVLVGSREMRALGIESAYSLVDLVGEERALSAPADALADLAARVARTWSR